MMQAIFEDMLHKNIKFYKDDLVAKFKWRSDHLHDVRELLERLRKFQLKINHQSAYLFSHLRNS